MVSCQKGPTRRAYAWPIGPFWQDTLDIRWQVIISNNDGIYYRGKYMYATFDLDDLARVYNCLAILHFKKLFFDKKLFHLGSNLTDFCS